MRSQRVQKIQAGKIPRQLKIKLSPIFENASAQVPDVFYILLRTVFVRSAMSPHLIMSTRTFTAF